jgi:alkanesulfonate monooxygenase SsuD/methylene tetrahydromethanopterin reductase-like flavin-dependent oxidoreductase (luciferase family)
MANNSALVGHWFAIAGASSLTRLTRSSGPRASGLWTDQPFSHHGAHYSFDDVQCLPTPLQQPRNPVWVSAMARNERTLGRAARWDGVILGTMTPEGAMEVLPADAVAEVAHRPDAHADIVVAAPVGTDPDLYRDSGATWVLITGWLDELRDLAGRPPPATTAG